MRRAGRKTSPPIDSVEFREEFDVVAMETRPRASPPGGEINGAEMKESAPRSVGSGPDKFLF